MNHRFLDAAALARIGNLEFVARQVVEGFISGRHRSPYHGFSVEYADHRQYTPGDDPRMLDWKVLARSDKYYVKLFEEETNLRAHLLLDASASMSFRSGAHLDKFSYGAYMIAALAYLLVRQNDAVGLSVFDAQIRSLLPPRATPVHFRRILDALGGSAAKEDTAIAPVLHELAERVRGRGLVVLVSDLLDDVDAVMHGLQHLRHRRHEVVVFHLIDPAERDFPYERMSRFRDLEGGGQLVANPKALRAKYLERFRRFLDDVAEQCHRHRIDHHLVATDEPYDRFLGHYLEKRARLG
jgi:uncharacterized protein (DUF58 family)